MKGWRICGRSKKFPQKIMQIAIVRKRNFNGKIKKKCIRCFSQQARHFNLETRLQWLFYNSHYVVIYIKLSKYIIDIIRSPTAVWQLNVNDNNLKRVCNIIFAIGETKKEKTVGNLHFASGFCDYYLHHLCVYPHFFSSFWYYCNVESSTGCVISPSK